MSDWGPVFVGVILFVLLSPGLFFQLPGHRRWVEFGNFQTSGAAVMVHALFYSALVCVFLLGIKVHLICIVTLIYHPYNTINYINKGGLCNKFNFSLYLENYTKMADWGPVVIAVVLFVLLSPGLLFQLPGRGRVVEFGNMQTSGLSILVHTVIFFGLITIFLIAIGVHIYTG
ncbi:hypothetical protein Pfo_009245 [Paulownia fortunei]|nr:hypothetical protein Pfo_009245 [Paulownia fortunei]